ncbi:MAG: YidH family protein [Frankiaceae bacterium]
MTEGGRGAGHEARTTEDRLDVDVRFVLANERTFLAWLRTALSLQAAGVVLAQAVDRRGATVAGLALLALGTATLLIGYAHHRAADRAIRAGTLPARSRGIDLVTAGVLLVAIAVFVVYAVAGL